MKNIALCLLAVLLAIPSAALCDVPKSIFDDDWKPDVPQQAQPPAPLLTPNPTPTTVPTPTPTSPTPDSTVAPSTKPAVPPSAPVVARLPVPTAAAQGDSWKLIKSDLYKDDIANAKTPAAKVELAGKLLAVARDTNKDPVGKYVLLAQAKELAISSGDPPTAFKCLDELGKVYDINYPAMKLDLFAALAKTVSSPADCQTLVDGLNRWADLRVKSDRYDAANRACDIAQTTARTNKESGLINETLLHQKQIAEIEAAYVCIKPTILTLTDQPTDPAANLTVGRFYCFLKGDWKKGMPMLALGADAGLKALAAKELAGVSDADSQFGLADSWWEIGEKEQGLQRDRIREHAARWYEQALPNLEGLAKAKVENRLKEVESPPSDGRRVVNLLDLVDLQRDVVQGKWQLASGTLVCAAAGCVIQFPYQPPEEYDFRIVFTRAKRGDCVNQCCTEHGRQFMWMLNGYGSTTSGFELVGGDAHNPSNRISPANQLLENDRMYTSIVKVRKTGVEAYLNRKLISEWKTDYSDMTAFSGWGLPRNDVLGLGCNGITTFRTVEVIEISGKGKILTEGKSVGN